MMYGVDVSGAVIEGEWGLNRPGVVAPTVILPYMPAPVYPAPGAYFPATGHKPRVGRLEVIPPANRRLPPPAEPYYRLWTERVGARTRDPAGALRDAAGRRRRRACARAAAARSQPPHAMPTPPRHHDASLAVTLTPSRLARLAESMAG